MSKRELANRLRGADIIYRETVTLRSGKTSDYYTDIKKAYGDPELLAEIAKATLKIIDDHTTCIAVAGYGGLPLGVAVASLSGLPLALVRDTEKNHGKQGMIDGYTPTSSDSITILDDVFTTGSSLLQTSETLLATEAHVIGCHVVVAREEPHDFKLPVTYLFTPQDLIAP